MVFSSSRVNVSVFMDVLITMLSQNIKRLSYHISEEQRPRLHDCRNPKIYVQVNVSYELNAVLMSHKLIS